MTNDTHDNIEHQDSDCGDALAAVALLLIVVTTMSFWLYTL